MRLLINGRLVYKTGFVNRQSLGENNTFVYLSVNTDPTRKQIKE
jgi:hypothetical protein